MKTAEASSVPFFFPQQLPSLFFEPRRYRPHGVGYWSGHIPFACDLVHTLRPQTLVELGTHTGESYFSFCQAIEESGIDCRSFAVDTWRGDQHTGAYSEQVFNEVKACNKRYGQFSQLLRMTFDQAAAQFTDGSIDLLHIDGAHVYEAVKHDFELWWPKVKVGGVVIMHDSNERGHDFGVWRFLDELRERFPAEEFLQSHGLAVVVKPPIAFEELPTTDSPDAAKSAEVPLLFDAAPGGLCASMPNVAAALVTARGDDLQAIRRYYEMCAAFQRQRYLTAQRTPDEWDVNAQLFWRSEGETFSEENSVRAAEIVGAGGETLLLPIPKCVKPLVELRIVPSLEPALLTVKDYRIEDSQGERVCGASGVSDLSVWQSRGLQAAAGSQGALVFDKTGRNAFTHALTSEITERLQAGGRLYLTLLGMDAFQMAVEVAASRAVPEGLQPAERPSLFSRFFVRP